MVTNGRIFFYFMAECISVCVQLALEQHRFELHRSTYAWNFYNRKYYSTASSPLAESTGTE